MVLIAFATIALIHLFVATPFLGVIFSERSRTYYECIWLGLSIQFIIMILSFAAVSVMTLAGWAIEIIAVELF